MPRVSELALPAEWLKGEIAVVGLARSGRSAARLLARAGEQVYASDMATSPELVITERDLRNEGVSVELDRHDLARIGKASLVVASPGVPPDAPPFVEARKARVPIVSEIEIGLRFLPRLNYIAITGTNGKTTTTALTGHLLTCLGYDAATAGNIGTPLTELALAATDQTLSEPTDTWRARPHLAPPLGVRIASGSSAEQAPGAVARELREVGLKCRAQAPRGGLLLAHHPHQVPALRQAAREWVEAGQLVRVLAAADLPSEIGSDAFAGGLLMDRTAAVQPAKLHAALVARACAAGADVQLRTRATRLERRGQGFLVEV